MGIEILDLTLVLPGETAAHAADFLGDPSEGQGMVVLVQPFLYCDEQPAQNWSGQGESDCLIKTKHCDDQKWF